MPIWSSPVTPTTHSTDRRLDQDHHVGSIFSLPATAEPAELWTLLDATKTGYKIERCLVPYDLDTVAQALNDAQRPLAA